MNKIEEAYKVLKRARVHIAKRGNWIKGNFNINNHVCALGAIGLETNTYDETEASGTCAAEFLALGIRKEFPHHPAFDGDFGADEIPDFNDHETTTKSQMLKAWDRAIAEARKTARALKKQNRRLVK